MKNDTSAKKGAKNTILFIAIFMMFLGAIGYYEFLSPSQEHLKKNTVERLLPDAHVHAQTSKKEKVLFTVATDNEEIELVRKELHEASKQRFVNYLDILSLKGQCVLLDKVSYAATGFLYTRAPKEQRLFLEKLINSTSFSLNEAMPLNCVKILEKTETTPLTSRKDNKEIQQSLKARNQAFRNYLNTLRPKEQRARLEKRINSTMDLFDTLSLKELNGLLVKVHEAMPPISHFNKAKILEQLETGSLAMKKSKTTATERFLEKSYSAFANHLNTLPPKEQRALLERAIKPPFLTKKSKEKWNRRLDFFAKYGYKVPKDFYYQIQEETDK
jgi:hypothetical protein